MISDKEAEGLLLRKRYKEKKKTPSLKHAGSQMSSAIL